MCVKAVRKHIDEIDPWSKFNLSLSYINMHMNAQRPQDKDDGPFLVHVVIS